jgi:hypothetical protein
MTRTSLLLAAALLTGCSETMLTGRSNAPRTPVQLSAGDYYQNPFRL